MTEFQFHKGTIKTEEFMSIHNISIVISIP